MKDSIYPTLDGVIFFAVAVGASIGLVVKIFFRLGFRFKKLSPNFGVLCESFGQEFLE
jgi:hypothetical protein